MEIVIVIHELSWTAFGVVVSGLDVVEPDVEESNSVKSAFNFFNCLFFHKNY